LEAALNLMLLVRSILRFHVKWAKTNSTMPHKQHLAWGRSGQDMVSVQQGGSASASICNKRSKHPYRSRAVFGCPRACRDGAPNLSLAVVVTTTAAMLLLLLCVGSNPTSRWSVVGNRKMKANDQSNKVLAGGQSDSVVAGAAANPSNVRRDPASSSQTAVSTNLDRAPSLSSSSTEFVPPSCPYLSLADLTPEERYPTATSTRHIVDPPPALTTTGHPDTALVCCHTTAGPISVAVHKPWAPLGAQRFLDMVRSRYFSTPINALHDPHLVVPLMRCVDEFLCQFGLRGSASEQYASKVKDDPHWLPPGKAGRSNELGVKRFKRGYLAYAGSGPHSRGRQLFLSMGDQSGLGTSPWEVPFGELVGEHSYDTLARIYTGYGEDGPSQESLMTDQGLVEARRDFPQLDWITSCHVVEEDGSAEAGGVKIAQ
jgi:peptidyl-prolyl cis-trans isomerase A (cyclophilin A)